MKNRILLIFPPLAKACEPPAGITRIAGFLRGNNQECTLWDANIESQKYLLNLEQYPEDTWSKRAYTNIQKNLSSLRDPLLYTNQDRYQRAVLDCNRALSQSCKSSGIHISLSDYQDNRLSPHQSADLLTAATHYQRSLFFPYYKKRFPELLTETNCTHIGISLNYLSQALPAFALAGYLRKEYPSLTLIIGGGLITSWMRSPGWSNPFGDLFDHIIEGAGEDPLLRLLGQTSHQPHHPPDFKNLPLGDYLAPGLILPYSASSGCYWNRCSFCPEKAEGGVYKRLSPAHVLQDLQHLKGLFKPHLIHMLDNAVAPSLMREMIAEPIGTDWYGFARVSPELAEPSFCRQLRESGCLMLKLGIESGSQKVLDSMDKGIDLALVEKSLAALKSAGIVTYVYLLFGTPAETLAEAQQTLNFTVRNADTIGFLNLAVFNLPRNSEETESLNIHNFSDADLGLYCDFTHPGGWNRKNVRNFLANDFKTHPKIKPILQRDPPFFTSNHAPFMVIQRNRKKKKQS